MTALVFVDTNVFVYALDEKDPEKQFAARSWRDELWKTGRGRISFQVLQEGYAQLSRMWPGTRSEAQAEIRNLLDWKPVAVDATILEAGWQLQDRYQLSFWDAMIVAAAKAAGCRYLLTEDLQAGQNLDGIVVVNPFVTAPESLAGR